MKTPSSVISHQTNLTLILWSLVSFLGSTFVFYAVAITGLDMRIHAVLFGLLIVTSEILIRGRLHLRIKFLHRVIIMATLTVLYFLPIYDLSSDSISIYNTAQQMIFKNWNFFRDPYGESFILLDNSRFDWENPSYVSAAAKLPYAMRNQFYWLFQQNAIYVVNFWITCLLLLFIGKSEFLLRYKAGFARIAILTATISPTVAAQFFSSYSDFYVAVFSTFMLFAILERAAASLEPGKIKILDGIIWVSAGLLLNSKLSGFIASTILLICAVFSLRNFSELKLFLKCKFSSWFFLAAAFLGAQLYYNLRVFQDAFFPVGKSTTSILMGSQAGFIFDFQPIGFLKSHFGIPSVGDLNALAPNWLFNFGGNFMQENLPLLALGRVDTRVSGFGFGFGLILLYVIFLLARDIFLQRINRVQSSVFLTIIMMLPFMPGSYWARLIIYLYPLVLVILIREQLAKKPSNPRITRGKTRKPNLVRNLIPGVLISALTINSIIALCFSLNNVYTENRNFQRFVHQVEVATRDQKISLISSRNSFIPNALIKKIPTLSRGACTIEDAQLVAYETWICVKN